MISYGKFILVVCIAGQKAQHLGVGGEPSQPVQNGKFVNRDDPPPNILNWLLL